MKERRKQTITASIVLYRENLIELTETINCFLNISLDKKLFLIDNTPNKEFKDIFKQSEIEYIPIGKNIGFGTAHNVVLEQIRDFSKFHLVLNPDVTFNPQVIPNLILELEKDAEIAMVAPKVLFPNNEHQYSCRRYPSILELFVRRVLFLNTIFKNTIYKGQYRDKDLDKPFFAEYITGCFQLYKTADFVKINGFDERYFLYMEDVDICKKIDVLGKKKLYYPQEEIIHVLKQGSSKKIKLFLRHSISVFKFFFKH